MAFEKIELRRIRSFSETLSDVLQFLKQEFKPLMRSFFLIGGFFILAGAVLNGLYTKGASNVWIRIFQGRDYYSESTSITSMYGITYFLALSAGLLTHLIIYTVVASYIKAYAVNDKVSPSLEEVWGIFKKNIIYVVFYGFILGFLTSLATLFCIAPGVYLGTVFAPFAYVIVMEEDKSLGHIFSRCFTLIKENFWPALGLYIISALLYYFCANITGIVVGGIVGLISYFTTKDVYLVAGLVTGILQIFSGVFSIILYLSIGFQYFSMDEKENGTGIMSRIQNMNSDTQEDRSTY